MPHGPTLPPMQQGEGDFSLQARMWYLAVMHMINLSLSQAKKCVIIYLLDTTCVDRFNKRDRQRQIREARIGRIVTIMRTFQTCDIK